MALGDPPSREGAARADRQFARQVLLGLVVVTAVAIIGPLVSYRGDVEDVRSESRGRIYREASVYAESLGLHLELLQTELERLAQRPEIDPLDNQDATEAALMEPAHHHSAMFRAGVAVVDSSGRQIWSEPKDLLARNRDVTGTPFFQKLLSQQGPVIEPRGGDGGFVLAVPVVRHARIVGAVIGLVDPTAKDLPGAQPVGPNRELAVLDGQGRVYLPQPPPGWVNNPAVRQNLEHLLSLDNGDRLSFDGEWHFAAAQRVRNTGLLLVLVAQEQAVTAPIRARVLDQLLFIAILQVSTMLLFSVYLRRSYRRFVDMEAGVAEQQKMAALGTAASLIAHEVKNSLNGLNAAASLLTSGADRQLPVRTIRGQTDRLRHLASSLLHFGKPETAHLVPVQLNDVAREAVEGLKVLPEAEEVRLNTSLDQSISIRGDPMLLVTAIDNLVRNAIEAAVIAKDTGKVETPEVRVSAQVLDGHGVVRVEDNAGGPPNGFEDHLFHPFVTSKPKGIGLGLSMARRAVEQQGGQLRFERTPSGSAFILELPIERSAIGPAAADRAANHRPEDAS